MRTTLALLLVLALAAACGAERAGSEATGPATRDWPGEDERRLDPEHAPTPFTAAQIRAGCPDGLRAHYLVEGGGKKVIQIFTFDKGDEEAVDFALVMETEGGTSLGARPAHRMTWTSLQGHASFAADQTKIEDETITVPAGTYECMRYTVTKSAKDQVSVATYWFAYELPGAPVKWQDAIDGKVTQSRILTRREDVQ